MMNPQQRHEQGFALITALIMLVVLGALLTAYLRYNSDRLGEYPSDHKQ
ncbi:MAG: hypothetical protein U5L04_11010 [Trueperaceae bacterium]|nr:hypothetical protein [Trueperaceae bacterium]